MASNNSVLKAFKVLEVISQYPDGINLSSIVKETGLPKSTVFDICSALYQVDAIYYKDKSAKTYVIGSKMYVMGQIYTQNSNFINASAPFLKEFADKYNLSTSAAKRLHNTSVNVFKYQSNASKVMTSDVGDQVKLDKSVSGKVFLAYLNKDRLNEAYKELKIADESFKKEIKSIREQGYALNNDEASEYIYSIAVPVFNFENKNIGVLSATSIKNNLDVKVQIDELINIANKVSKILGYQK